MGNKILLNNVNVDTDSDNFESAGGPAVINVRGDNFGGGQVIIEVASKNDPSNPDRFTGLDNGTFTANKTVKVDYLPVATLLRARLTGSAGASNVFADVQQ